MPRAKTENLPGVPNSRIIAEVSSAAEEYETLKDKRVKLLAQEVEANAKLVEIMKKHKLKAYRDDDYAPPLLVELAAKDATLKAKVKREKAGRDDE